MKSAALVAHEGVHGIARDALVVQLEAVELRCHLLVTSPLWDNTDKALLLIEPYSAFWRALRIKWAVIHIEISGMCEVLLF